MNGVWIEMKEHQWKQKRMKWEESETVKINSLPLRRPLRWEADLDQNIVISDWIGTWKYLFKDYTCPVFITFRGKYVLWKREKMSISNSWFKMGIWSENKCTESPYVPYPDGLFLTLFNFKGHGQSELEEILENNLTTFFIFRWENGSSKQFNDVLSITGLSTFLSNSALHTCTQTTKELQSHTYTRRETSQNMALKRLCFKCYWLKKQMERIENHRWLDIQLFKEIILNLDVKFYCFL